MRGSTTSQSTWSSMLVLVALTLLCGWWTQVEAIKFEMKAEINPDAHQSK